MASRRKTIDLSALVDKANSMLLNTPDDKQDFRRGVSCLIEEALHLANAYNGFNSLTAKDMEKSANGKTCGIIFDESPARNHVYPDKTRVFYYHPKGS